MGVVSDVQDYLEEEGLVDGSTEWQSLRRNRQDKQDKIVVITEDGGPEPEIYKATGIGDAAVRDSGVQILVRAERLNGDAAQEQAQAIYDALHGLTDTTLGETEYIRVVALTSEPSFLQDENERPLVTWAYRLMALASA